jgi:hypothetical protein
MFRATSLRNVANHLQLPTTHKTTIHERDFLLQQEKSCLKYECLWRLCIVIMIKFLDIIHRPNLIKRHVLDTGICLRHQVKPTVFFEVRTKFLNSCLSTKELTLEFGWILKGAVRGSVNILRATKNVIQSCAFWVTIADVKNVLFSLQQWMCTFCLPLKWEVSTTNTTWNDRYLDNTRRVQ